MALSIGVNRGSQIQIGKSMVRVIDIRPGTVVVAVNNGPAVILSENESTELMPEVFAFVGLDSKESRFCDSRIAFEAPRRIAITRVKNEVPASTHTST